jgi:glycosyl transferase, family 25
MTQYLNFLNQTFDKIYVITLQRATDRHAHFHEELKGLNYTVFYGKDKQDFNIEELKRENIYNEELARKHHRFNKPMPAGMIGCSWSHQLVYSDIVKNKYQRALILEDDIVLNRQTLPNLPEIFKELPPDWELVYFGFAGNETAPPRAGLKKAFYHFLRLFRSIRLSHTMINHLYPVQFGEHVYQSGYHDCTHAYGLTLQGAETLLALQTPVSFFPDSLLAYAATNKLVNAYIILPRMIDQQSQLTSGPIHSYINE